MIIDLRNSSNKLFLNTRIFFCLLISLWILDECLVESIVITNRFIKKYSTVDYDVRNLHDKHSRVQRSLDNNIKVSFRGYGREFNLKLIPSKNNYFEKAFIEFKHKKDEFINLPDVIIYEGYLIDEPDTSNISGSIIQGLFVGSINTKNGKYFVEPAKRYNQTTDSHSIIYHENDINSNDELKAAKDHLNRMMKESGLEINKNDKGDISEESGGAGCGSHDNQIKEILLKEQMQSEGKRQKRDTEEGVKPNFVDDILFKYSEEANLKEKILNRKKRDTPLTFPGSKTVCSLYIRVDPYFYDKVFANEGNNDVKLTLNYITSYLSQQVVSLNSIYNTLKFYTDSSATSYYTGVQFKIKKIKIFTFDTCKANVSLTDAEAKLCLPYLDVVTFLNYVSLDNYDNYCLSFTFSGRDFGDGTLGLAWVSTTSTTPGGLCEKQVNNQGVLKSYNCGLVTTINYNQRVPLIVQQVTFAHEVGHSFGSDHDLTSSCTPGDSNGGNYIMYSRATSGTLPNNKKFSSCSLNEMGPVLNYVVQNKFCFMSATAAICGNGIVETGETCDCGFLDVCTDTCCDNTTCQLKPGAICSPSQGPCCESTCNYSNNTKVCLKSNECTSDLTCSGTSYSCPVASATSIKENLSLCNGGTQVCINGTCTGSMCQRYGLNQCYLSGNLSDSSVDKSTLCHMACNGSLTNYQCKDSFSINSNIVGVSMQPGSPCASTLGYCDIFSKCRSVNSQSALSRLTQTLLTPPSLNDIKTWAVKYWWAILIFCIIFFVIFNIVVFLLSKLLPSSNPNKQQEKKMRKRPQSRQQILRSNSSLGSNEPKIMTRKRQQVF